MRDPEDLYQRIVEQQLALLQQPKQEEQPSLKKTGWLIPLVAGLAYASGRNNTTGVLKALLAGIGTASALNQPTQTKPDEKMLEFRRKVLEDLRQSADTIRTIRERHKMSQLTEELLGGSLSPEEYMASMASLGELDQAASILNRMTEMTVLPNGKAIIAYPGGVKSVVDLYDPNDTADLAVAAAALKQSGNEQLANDIQQIIASGKDSLKPGRYKATAKGLQLVEPLKPASSEAFFYTVDDSGTLQPVTEKPTKTNVKPLDVPSGLAVADEVPPATPDVPGGLAVADEVPPAIPDVPGGAALIDDSQEQEKPEQTQAPQKMPTLVPKSVDLGPVKLRAANIVTEDKPAWRPIYENGRLVRVEFAPVGTPLEQLPEDQGWNYGDPPSGWDQPKLLESRIRAAERAKKLWKQIIHTIFNEDGTLNKDALAGLVGYTNSPFPTWVAKTDRPYSKEAEKLISMIRPFIMNIVYAKSGKQTAVQEFDNWMNTILPDAMNASPLTAWMKLKSFEEQMLLPPLEEGEVGLEQYFTKWESPLDSIYPANDESALDTSDMIRRFGKGLLDEVSKLITGKEVEPGFLVNWMKNPNVVKEDATPPAVKELREKYGRNRTPRRGKRKKREDLRRGRIIRE